MQIVEVNTVEVNKVLEKKWSIQIDNAKRLFKCLFVLLQLLDTHSSKLEGKVGRVPLFKSTEGFFLGTSKD